jgi:hypothetical protein
MAGPKADTNYVVIIGDIRGSRQMPRRAEFQKVMEQRLEAINRDFGEKLAAAFVVTLGDEFQALLRRPEDVMDVLVALDFAFPRDTPIRYGIGWGPISTELRDRAVGMDGPCFHNAREAVQRGKRDDRWATVLGLGEDDRTINALLRLVGEVRSRWTDVQRATVEQTRRSRTQREVAAARGVNESSVSQALKAAMHEPVMEAEEAVVELLRRHGEAERVDPVCEGEDG